MVVKPTPGLTSSSRDTWRWMLVLRCWLASQVGMEKKHIKICKPFQHGLSLMAATIREKRCRSAVTK